MSSLMQQALGAEWDQLPAGLQAHYQAGGGTDVGAMDIDYPWFMQCCLTVLHWFGILLNRRGNQVQTRLVKTDVGALQYWRRTITFADGQAIHFNSCWTYLGSNQLIEFVNPYLGLQMAVRVDEGRLHYAGVCFVVKLGRMQFPLPEWLLGHTTIVEEGLGERSFAMDFRLTHPLFGQVFRYAGVFESLALT